MKCSYRPAIIDGVITYLSTVIIIFVQLASTVGIREI